MEAQIHQGALLSTLPLMTRKELLPLLRTRGGAGTERLGGAQASAQRVVGWGLGPGRGRDWRALTRGPACLRCGQLLPPASGSPVLTTTPGVHRAATLRLSHHSIPTPCLQTHCSRRWGSGAWWGGEQGWRLWRQRYLGLCHQPALDPTGRSGGTSIAPLESPTPTPPLSPRLLSHPLDFTFPILSWAPDLRPLPTPSPHPGPALLGAPLP